MAQRPNPASAGSREGKAKASGMRFRRRRRQAQVDLSALDRLAELVERIVALLPEQPVRRKPQPPAEPVQVEVRVPAPEPLPKRADEPARLFFVASASGYRLVEPAGGAPSRGDRVKLADGTFRVLRVGPSPLPGDRRRCAFLEREEPSVEARTPDG